MTAGSEAPASVAASYKGHFRRFLEAAPQRLHFAAHSHHYWPDVTFQAQIDCWQDAARLADGKWAHVFGEVMPAVQRGIARSEEHTSELQSLMRISYAVFCLKKKNQ